MKSIVTFPIVVAVAVARTPLPLTLDGVIGEPAARRNEHGL